MQKKKALLNRSNKVKYMNIKNGFVRFISVVQLFTLIDEVCINVKQYTAKN